MLRELVDLQPYNTLALHARAAVFCEPVSQEEFLAALSLARSRQLPVLPLGEGSNIVLTRDYPGLVLRLRDNRIQLLREQTGTVLVRVGAGLNWHQWVQQSLDNGWYGLENLALIPGTVGASPVQNIGAYGVEVAQFIDSVQGVYLDSGEAFDLDNKACRFAYRDSLFKQALAHKTVITSVVFRLSTVPAVHAGYAALRDYLAEHHADEPLTPTLVMEAVCAVRRSRLPDPHLLPNVGSFFKNPQVSPEQFVALQQQYPAIPHYPGEQGRVKLAAAWLIDQCGWKGRCLGPACVHEHQALVLVNRHGASGEEMLALADAIAADVLARFAVRLEPEPWIW